MRRSSWLWLAALAAGCVPLLPHDYLEPSAEGGVVAVNRCWGTRDEIVIDLGAVKAFARVARFPPEQRFVELRLQVPPGHVLVPASDEALFETAGFRTSHRLSVSLNGNATLPMQPVGPLVGGKTAVGDFDRNYWLFAPLANDREPVEVRFPEFTLDGQARSLPPVRFTPRTHVQVIAPLQC